MNKKEKMDDIQLVKSCLQGEEEEFRKIVDRYRGKIMALALNILRHRQDAEDACQEAFIQVYRNLDKFDTRKSFSNWLYTILYNRCLDQLRKRRRFYRLFQKVKNEPFYNCTQTSSQSAHKPLPQSLLKMLSPRERAALFLWANEGYTSDEIAEILNCSSSTVRVNLFKARKKIKTVLEKQNVSM